MNDNENKTASGNQNIIADFEDWHAEAFRDLNYEWLEEFFEVEPYDKIVLSGPRKHIINQGGSVLVALDGLSRSVFALC
ncbi:MAG: hypothetical protein P1R58_02775 [bacterium]|nr:hypothetical protein [bacterium]